MTLLDRVRADRRGAALWAAVALVFFVAYLMMLWAPGRIPGINGDEAWFALRIRQFLKGLPVDLTTPTQRTASYTYAAVGFLAEAMSPIRGPASFWVVRAPGLIFGLMTPLVVFFLYRRGFNRTTATVTAILTACLPLNLAYARMGWEPSLVFVFAMMALYLAFHRNWFGLVIAFTLGTNLHPVFVFCRRAPFCRFSSGSSSTKSCRPGAVASRLSFVRPALSRLSW